MKSIDLLGKKRFLPFFLTQFFGALNDNLYKNGLTVFIAFQSASISQSESNDLVNIAAGLFILPFFLFSTIAGQLADKYEKSYLISRIKLLEIIIMLFAGLAFYLNSMPLLIGLLFLMGTQSSLFGPVKYSLLPQVLKDDELIGGNALVQFGTFIAILIGLIAGVLITSIENTGTSWLSAAVLMMAIIGYQTSLRIPRAKANAPELKIDFNLVKQFLQSLHHARENRSVFYSIMGISWFWFLGITYVTQLPNYVRYELGGNEQVYVLLLAMFSIGIGAGSFLCEKMSGRIVEIGLVPIGSLGLTLFGIDLYFTQNGVVSDELISPWVFATVGNNPRIMMDLFFLGVFGGIYIVPLFALVQQRSEATKRARIIAANNVLNALFMVVATGFSLFALSSGLNIAELFLVMSLMNAAVALWIFTLIPEFIMRLLVWLLIHTVYRVKKTELESIPDTGACVLVCNHVSFVDALILAGCIKRPIRFVMNYKIFNTPVLSFVFKTANAIPIAGARENPQLMNEAFEKISAALDDDEIVCVFPEGKITHDGKLNPFKSGVMKILEQNPVPVVPLALRGLWGSFFSRKHGSAMSKCFPRGFFNRIELVSGDAIAAEDVSLELLQQTVESLVSTDR
ncbi:MAG: MFS transporter [Thiotrichaceae bacterium]|nr:MFS transporter [Thiotrichaceae bacterium]